MSGQIKKAKEATKYTTVDLLINFSKTEMRDIVKQRIKEKWQKQWDEERKGRWFYRVQNKVGGMRTAGRNRNEERVISRLKLGHTGLNDTLR